MGVGDADSSCRWLACLHAAFGVWWLTSWHTGPVPPSRRQHKSCADLEIFPPQHTPPFPISTLQNTIMLFVWRRRETGGVSDDILASTIPSISCSATLEYLHLCILLQLDTDWLWFVWSFFFSIHWHFVYDWCTLYRLNGVYYTLYSLKTRHTILAVPPPPQTPTKKGVWYGPQDLKQLLMWAAYSLKLLRYNYI